MSNLSIVFTAIIVGIVSNNAANTLSAQDIDIDRLLSIIHQQKLNHDSVERSDSSDESESSEESIANKAEEDNIINIIKQLINSKNKKQSNNDRIIYKERPSNLVQSYKSQISPRSKDVVNVLSQLLNSDLKTKSQSQARILSSKKRLTPNRLLWSESNRNTDLDDYSKIYVLLTPKAVQKSRSNPNGVNNLISRILSLSSSSSNQNRQSLPKQRRYKGFVLNNGAGRRRGSRELYAPDDSLEDKPKRSRNTGGGGHTAIPYIRHRGENIYEKDN